MFDIQSALSLPPEQEFYVYMMEVGCHDFDVLN
jgi:hypothetical protein